MSTTLSALGILAASAVSATVSAAIAERRVGGRLDPLQRVLNRLILFTLFYLIPVHLAGMIELAGLRQGVSPQFVFLISLLVLGTVSFASRLASAGRVEATATGREKGEGASGKLPTYLKLSFAILGLTYGLFLLDLATTYPRGFDAIRYHLPLGVRWLQLGTLSIPEVGDWMYSLPSNGEIGIYLALAVGRQAMTAWVNLMALAVFSVSTIIIGRRLSPRPDAYLIALLILLSIPLVMYQAFSGYIDLFGAAFVVGGVAVLCSWRRSEEDGAVRKGNGWVVLLAASSWGIAAGSKPTFLLYVAVCVMVGFVALVRDDRRDLRGISRASVALIIGLSIPTAFWFLRAWMATGNPLYPIRIDLLGSTILSGFGVSEIMPPDFDLMFVRGRLEWVVYPWTEFHRTGFAYSPGSGLGASWATFVPIGLAFSLIATLRRRASGRAGRVWPFALLFALVASWWLLLGRMPRFGIPIIWLATLLTIPFLDFLSDRAGRAVRILVLASVATTCAIAGSRTALSILARVRNGEWSRASFYDYPAVIDQLPPGSVIWSQEQRSSMIFPLAGRSLTNVVIPSRWHAGGSLSDFLSDHSVDFIFEVEPYWPHSIEPTRDTVVAEGALQSGERWRLREILGSGGAPSDSVDVDG